MTSIQSTPPLSGGFMLHALAKNWWLILLRGVCAVAFGVLTFVWPAVTLLTLIVLYGAFALADGVLALWAGMAGGAPAPRWWLIVVGLLGIAAGFVTLLMPGLTALVLLYVISFWAIASGVMQIVGAVRLRKEIENEWALIASGVVLALFGIVMLVAPGTGALGLLFVIGIFAIIEGVMLIALSIRLKRHNS